MNTYKTKNTAYPSVLPLNGRCFSLWLLKQNYAVILAGLSGVIVPEGYLNLAYVGFAEKQHGKSGLSDTSTHSEGKLSVQQHLVERVLSSCVCIGKAELLVQ